MQETLTSWCGQKSYRINRTGRHPSDTVLSQDASLRTGQNTRRRPEAERQASAGPPLRRLILGYALYDTLQISMGISVPCIPRLPQGHSQVRQQKRVACRKGRRSGGPRALALNTMSCQAEASCAGGENSAATCAARSTAPGAGGVSWPQTWNNKRTQLLLSHLSDTRQQCIRGIGLEGIHVEASRMKACHMEARQPLIKRRTRRLHLTGSHLGEVFWGPRICDGPQGGRVVRQVPQDGHRLVPQERVLGLEQRHQGGAPGPGRPRALRGLSSRHSIPQRAARPAAAGNLVTRRLYCERAWLLLCYRASQTD